MAGAKSKYTLTAEDRTKRAFKSVMGRAQKTSRELQRIGVVAGGTAVAGIAALTAKQARMIDSLDKSAAKLGTGTKELGQYRHAAEMTANMTGKDFDTALQRMTRRLAEAAQGSGEAKDAIKDLGLDAERLSEMAPTKAFREVAGAMKGVENQSDKVRIAFKLFDSEGASLVNTLALGKEGLDDMAREADMLGQTFSRVDAARVVQANDAMTRAGKIVTGVGNEMAIQLAPIVQQLGTDFLNTAREAGGMGEVVSKSLGVVVKAVGHGANIVRGWELLWLQFGHNTNTVIGTIVKGIDDAIKNLVPFGKLLAKLVPNAEETFAEIDAIGQGMIDRAGEFQDRLSELSSKPLPLKEIEEWHAEVESRAKAHANRLVGINDDKNDRILTDEMLKNNMLRDINTDGNSEQEKENAKHFKRVFQQGAQNSKKLFQLQKAQKIAEAILGLKSTIVSSYEFGAKIGGPPLGAAMAAIGGAAQMANIASLKSSSFGGGGGGSGGGGGGSSSSVPSVNSMVEQQREEDEGAGGGPGGEGAQPSFPQFSVNIEDDDMVTGRAVRRFVDRMNKAIRTGEAPPVEGTSV